MSFFSSGPPSDADHGGYDDEDDQSQDGAHNYFGDQRDDFHSDDAYEDEFETSQNTIHNSGGQVGALTSRDDSRDETNGYHSPQSAIEASYYDAAEYSEDESVKEQRQDGSGIDLGGDGDFRGSSSKGAIRKEVDESTACDEEGIISDDKTVNQSNSADGIPSAKDRLHDIVDASRDSVPSADNATDGKSRKDSVALPLGESSVAADAELSRSVRSRGDTVQLNFQVFPQESGERRITETVEPAYPEKESTQPRAPRPASSSTVGSASPEVRALTAELNLGQGTRLFGKGAEKGIQPFVRPPVAQMSPGLGTRLIGGIADRGNAQEQKRGDATKLGLRRRFELGSQFTMSSQQENLGGEKRQKIVNRLPSLGRSLKVTQIDADAQEPANLRSSGTSDALKVAATSFKDGGQANLLENEVYGGSPSTPFDGGSTGDKKNASHYLDNSSLPDSLTWNFQRDTPIIADAVNFHLVRASDAASNKIFENEGVLSSAINSRIEITSGMTTSISADPSANKTSIFSANPTSTTSLEYLSRGLAVLPNASSRTNSTASTRGGEPVRQIRRTVEPLAKHGVSSNKGRITGDIEAQIDLVISGTSKRLRDIQQDYGNGGLELYSKKGGYDQSEPGSGGVTSEGPGKKSPQEMDCNVPAFVAALERDSHSLASALCRLMTNDALLLAPLLYKNEKGLSLLRDQLKSQ